LFSDLPTGNIRRNSMKLTAETGEVEVATVAESLPGVTSSPVVDKAASESAVNDTALLDQIKRPADLRALDRAQLRRLCQELRFELVNTLSKVGGHFASSLGATEISVALHAAFDTPHDRIVWDTGHQAYIHKILTGRRHKMSTIRQKDGISGFPRRSESDYDTFGVAHAGTSISAAIGMLEAAHHEFPGSDARRVVAVIGDGAMTAGMAFEALNHSGQLHRKLIVVLNDNEMSIAPNVGALSWAFSRAITGKMSTSARRHFKSLYEKGIVPRSFYRFLDRAEEAAQGFFTTPAMLFSSFGYRYIGPVDGNNIDQLLDALERAKEQDGPVLVHALTMKGKGYAPAEDDPVTFHGVGPFEVQGGTFKKASAAPAPSYTDVFGSTIVELCKSDPRVIAVTAAMPDGTGLTKLAKELPERFFDVGICEQHAVTFCAGLACEGMRPFCTVYSTFLQRGFDQVLHDVCIQSLPVIFAMDRAGLVGADGATHHGVFDIAFLRSLPNLTLMAPKDEAELRNMMFTAVGHLSGPIAIRYPRGNGVGVDITKPPIALPIGKAEVVKESKKLPVRVLLIGLGNTVQSCLDAATVLEDKHFAGATVVNARFVKPLDEALLSSLIPNHDLVVTVEDHAISGGFGSAVLEFMSENALCAAAPLVRLGVPDRFIDHGTQSQLYKQCGFDSESIVVRVVDHLSRGLVERKQAATGGSKLRMPR
jgi:1-deoxy-D-xylulose-5-phosphate synthase